MDGPLMSDNHSAWLNNLAKSIHDVAVEHGWWKTERQFPEVAALIHSEISEALECYRDGKPVTWYNYITYDIKDLKKKPEGLPIELADAIIRILDYCAKENIDIAGAMDMKMEYNVTRPYRHGGKLA